jgi:hypothetical protein
MQMFCEMHKSMTLPDDFLIIDLKKSGVNKIIQILSIKMGLNSKFKVQVFSVYCPTSCGPPENVDTF